MSNQSDRPLLIAEFCQNHNGDFDRLSEMVERAAENGATYGKIQAIFPENLVFRPQFEKGLIVNGETLSYERPYQAEYDRLKGLELSFRQIEKFVLLCQAASLKSMITIFAREHIPRIADMGFDAIKVASYDCGSFQFLRELEKHFKSIFISTGATYDQEIVYAAKLLQKIDVTFLHCVTIYPTPIKEMHLARMNFLRQFSKRVGFSDHSLTARDGLIGSKAALALGADVIERHFTILEPGMTKDGPVSITPSQLNELADFAQLEVPDRIAHMDECFPGWRLAIGQERRSLSHEELLNRDYYRGRFGSQRPGHNIPTAMIDNWEEVPLA